MNKRPMRVLAEPDPGGLSPRDLTRVGADRGDFAMTPTTKRVLSYLGAGLALAAMIGLGVFYAASTLLAPLWAAIVLWIIWATLFLLGIVWVRQHPLRVLALPVAAAAVWFGGISAGEAFLGWSG